METMYRYQVRLVLTLTLGPGSFQTPPPCICCRMDHTEPAYLPGRSFFPTLTDVFSSNLSRITTKTLRSINCFFLPFLPAYT